MNALAKALYAAVDGDHGLSREELKDTVAAFANDVLGVDEDDDIDIDDSEEDFDEDDDIDFDEDEDA